MFSPLNSSRMAVNIFAQYFILSEAYHSEWHIVDAQKTTIC